MTALQVIQGVHKKPGLPGMDTIRGTLRQAGIGITKPIGERWLSRENGIWEHDYSRSRDIDRALKHSDFRLARDLDAVRAAKKGQ